MAKAGVYIIKNTVNNKCYIGSSININKRFAAHKSKLRGNYHPNKFLQASWNKYGENVFEFKVLKECDHDLAKEEQQLIDLYKSSDNNYGYNLSKTAYRVDSQLLIDMWKDNNKKNDIINRMKKQASNIQAKEKRSKAAKNTWSILENKIKRSKISKLHRNTKKAKAKQSKITKELFENPKYRKDFSDIQNIVQNKPENKLKQLLASKRAIKIKCIETNIIYLSIRDAGKKTGISNHRIGKYLNTNKPVDGLRFITYETMA